MLTEAQKALRKNHFTASMAPALMGGDQERLTETWKICTGQIAEPDLSDNWQVEIGNLLEQPALNRHERKTGHALTHRGEFYQHPQRRFVGATVDAVREFDQTVIDAKCCGSFNPLDDIIRYYTPQVIVQMRSTGLPRGALLICHGFAEPREYEVVPDLDYEREVWNRIDSFWLCVETWTEPIALPKATPPDQWRTVNIDRPDCPENWAPDMRSHLNVWGRTKVSAELHAEANKEIRKLLPEDVGRVEYGAVSIVRNRAGAVSVKRR